MSKKPDTFTVVQAALILGVSHKRVRQLIEEGRLKAHSRKPVTIKQAEVIELKEARQNSPRVKSAITEKAAATNQVLNEIKTLIEQSASANRYAIETAEAAAKRNEENLINQINDLKAENEALKLRKRGFFRR